MCNIHPKLVQLSETITELYDFKHNRKIDHFSYKNSKLAGSDLLKLTDLDI